MKERFPKVLITIRLDPAIKEAAKSIARKARQTLSRYVEELIRLDLWRKGSLFGRREERSEVDDPRAEP